MSICQMTKEYPGGPSMRDPSPASQSSRSTWLVALVGCFASLPLAAADADNTRTGSVLAAGAAPQAAPERRVYVLRHGEAAYVAADGTPVTDTDAVGLTSRGREQSQAVGHWFREAGLGRFDRVFSSPLPRAMQSAAELLSAMRVEVQPETWPELREATTSGPDADAQLLAQARRVLDTLAADSDWRSVLLVAHRGVGRALLGVVLADPALALPRMELDTGCMVVLVHEPATSRWRVRSVNLCPDPARYVSGPPQGGTARH